MQPPFRFSWRRVLAIFVKELTQLKRDRLTFAMMVGVPVLQLVLFGYAINSDPKHLPTAVVALDNGPFVRSIVRAVENSAYFTVIAATSEREAEAMIADGSVQFALVFPGDFSTRLLRGERPPLVVFADASDPSATGAAVTHGAVNAAADCARA